MPSRPLLSIPWRRAQLAALAAGALVAAVTVPSASSRAAAPVAGPAAYEHGVVVVGFRANADARVERSTLARAGASAVAPEQGFSTVDLRRGVSVGDAIAHLRRERAVAYAVPDYIAHADAFLTPPTPPADALEQDDPLARAHDADLPAPLDPDDPGDSGVAGGWRTLQWNFAGPYGVNAEQAWGNVAAAGRPGGAGVIVAVLDTGVAYADHGPFVRSPDFTAGEFVKGWDFVDNSPYPEDRNGHGTQVAGTIAEATDNGIGVTGLAYGARIMPVRVLDSQGNGGAAAIADGIRFAVAHHAQIINMSLEFTAGTVKAGSIPELIDAIDYAHRHNVLVVAASGNEGVDELSYPAKAKWVVSVGATTPDGCLGYYSNYGAGLTLVAPGGGEDADLPNDPHCHPNESSDSSIYQETFANVVDPHYRSFGLPAGYFGTSMAAPHVSATAALIIASGVLGPHPTVAQIVTQLTTTATKLGANGDDPRHYGAGLVNAAAATEPVATIGPTGPSGPTGTTGTTGATGTSY